jgi:membrane protease YdiL (CAAX protease family)
VPESASADSFSPSPEVPADGPAGPTVLPVQRIGAVIEVVLCSGFPTQIILLGVLTSLGLEMQTETGRLSPSFVSILSLADAVLVTGLVFFFINAHRESARELLLGHRPIVREALVGIILMPLLLLLVFLVLALVLTFVPQLHNVPRNPFEDMLQTRTDTAAFAVVVLIAGGVREEIQRGFILRRFEQYLGGGTVGLVVFSALFGLGHIDQGIDAALATGLLGAAWGGVYLVRRSIVAPMVSHAAFNLAQLLKYVTLAGA